MFARIAVGVQVPAESHNHLATTYCDTARYPNTGGGLAGRRRCRLDGRRGPYQQGGQSRVSIRGRHWSRIRAREKGNWTMADVIRRSFSNREGNNMELA